MGSTNEWGLEDKSGIFGETCISAPPGLSAASAAAQQIFPIIGNPTLNSRVNWVILGKIVRRKECLTLSRLEFAIGRKKWMTLMKNVTNCPTRNTMMFSFAQMPR